MTEPTTRARQAQELLTFCDALVEVGLTDLAYRSRRVAEALIEADAEAASYRSALEEQKARNTVLWKQAHPGAVDL